MSPPPHLVVCCAHVSPLQNVSEISLSSDIYILFRGIPPPKKKRENTVCKLLHQTEEADDLFCVCVCVNNYKSFLRCHHHHHHKVMAAQQQRIKIKVRSTVVNSKKKKKKRLRLCAVTSTLFMIIS